MGGNGGTIPGKNRGRQADLRHHDTMLQRENAFLGVKNLVNLGSSILFSHIYPSVLQEKEANLEFLGRGEHFISIYPFLYILAVIFQYQRVFTRNLFSTTQFWMDKHLHHHFSGADLRNYLSSSSV